VTRFTGVMCAGKKQKEYDKHVYQHTSDSKKKKKMMGKMARTV